MLFSNLLFWNFRNLSNQFDNMFSFNSFHINKFSEIFFDVFPEIRKFSGMGYLLLYLITPKLYPELI